MNPPTAEFIEQLNFNEQGLIPAIAQDWLDGAVLMMAWMNRESIEKTIISGEVHYWSRSRERLWHKGETSGHTQALENIRFDCDADVILLTIKQKGSISCHKGFRSCFFNIADNISKTDSPESSPPSNICSELFSVIERRRSYPEPNSYTNKLLNGGDNQILKKIGEEAVEFVMACKDKDKESISNEAADLLFHLQVALANHDVSWEQVLKTLANRRGIPRRQTE